MPRSRILWASVLAGSVGLGAHAGAQEAEPEVRLGAPGTYQGVCPGTEHPPAVAPPANPGGNVITWPGFQMRPDGGSRIFVQSTGPISPTVKQGKKRIEVALGPAKLAHHNNALPLVTRFFNTPVEQASLRVKRGQATLVLVMRAKVTPTVRSEAQAATGYHFVYVDFPPGEYIPGAKLPVAKASAPSQPEPAPERSATAAAPSHLEGNVSGDASASGQVKGGSGKVEGKAEGKAEGKVSIGF